MNGQDDLDRRLEELGEAPPEAEAPPADPEAEARALEKRITRRIRRVCLKTLLGVVLCAALLLLCVNPLAKHYAMDPIEMQEDDWGFVRYLNAYYGTLGPYTQVVGVSIKDAGFGAYDASLGVIGAGDLKAWVGDTSDVRMSIKQGKATVTSDPNRLLTAHLGRFACDWNTREDILADLEKLPESCYIRLSVGTDAPLPLSELQELPLEVVWAEVYDPDSEFFQGGLALSPSVGFGGPERELGEMDDAQLAEYFARNLELLLTQPQLLQSLGLYSGSSVMGPAAVVRTIEEKLAFAREQTVLTSKNYCVAGEKAEIIAFLRETETTSLLVDHIFLSPLSD